MYVYTYVGMYVYMHVCMHACMCVSVYRSWVLVHLRGSALFLEVLAQNKEKRSDRAAGIFEENFKRDEKLCPYSVGSGNSRGFGILQYRDIVTKTEYIRTDSRAVADQTQWALQKLLWLSSEVNEKNEKWRQVI